MNIEQTAKVLTKIQLIDNRQVGQLTILEWHDIIGDLEYEDAIAAVRIHRNESTEYLTPAHIRMNISRVERDLRRRAGDFMRDRYGSSFVPTRQIEAIGRALTSPEALLPLLEAYEESAGVKPVNRLQPDLSVDPKYLTPGDGKVRPADEWMNR